MKRTILALALASFSIAAFALPPPGGAGTGGTLNVNVTNDVVPVQVNNAEPITVQDASRQLFRTYATVSLSGYQEVLVSFGPIEPDQRLVLEQFSWNCLLSTSTNAEVGAVALRQTHLSGPVRHWFRVDPLHKAVSPGHSAQGGAEQVRVYLEPGDDIRLYIGLSTTAGTWSNCSYAMHGYYEPL
jgi:hypothetical protein